jgi:hypothetical protein
MRRAAFASIVVPWFSDCTRQRRLDCLDSISIVGCPRICHASWSRRGQALPHDQLIAEVWGKDVFLTDRVIYTHINNLRQKIEPDHACPRLLVNVRGIGHHFDG